METAGTRFSTDRILSDLVVLCVTFGGPAFQALLRILVKSCSISVPGTLLEAIAIQVEPRANKDLHRKVSVSEYGRRVWSL
jgi:hypothetical protein